MARVLVALLSGRVIGDVHQLDHAELAFVYRDDWRTAPEAVPLSLSMPLARAKHGHEAVSAFLWGLLPDSDRVLDRWATQFHVSARNPFALLSHVGEDCPGAVQLTTPERVDALRHDAASPPEVVWLDELEVSRRLAALRKDEGAWRQPEDAGQFSLAGAQPKTALFHEDGRWGIPRGRTPTTHILKPPTGELSGLAENEHFCLRLAAQCGLSAARSEVRSFRGEVAIVVERYDRVRPAGASGEVLRVHQEDLCQALAIHPGAKYQNDGGPTPEQIVELLRTHSSRAGEDVSRFMDALVFNWLIVGTDAHAKNYSLLLGSGGRARLAPLYDAASYLPYGSPELHEIKLAMKVGGKYRVRDIGPAHFAELASAVRLDSDEMVQRVSTMADALPDHASDVLRRCRSEGLSHAILDTLVERLISRARTCAALA